MAHQYEVILGVITKAKGLAGEFIVKSNQPIESINWLHQKLYIHAPKEVKICQIKSLHFISPQLLKMQLLDIDNRSAVLPLIGFQIGINRKLIKWAVIHDQNDYAKWNVMFQNQKIGHVLEVVNYGAQNNFRIYLDKTQKNMLIPDINDFILKIDRDHQTIVLKQLWDF